MQIIAIASGKGGVGKSTVTVQLALALQKLNLTVGILDADIYGPSIPTLLNTVDVEPEITSAKKVKPVLAQQLETMSIAYLVKRQDALIWRGPMASKALQQLFFDTEWGKLDYLLIDLPPGTGDIQLTLAQKIPLSAAIMVSTPHPLAIADVTRAISMFNKVKVPILGLIENMASHTCEHCKHNQRLFGDKATYGAINILGSLPISNNNAELAIIYQDIATALHARRTLKVTQK